MFAGIQSVQMPLNVASFKGIYGGLVGDKCALLRGNLLFRRALTRHWMQRHVAGGANEIRTRDLLTASQTRYQLRHNPAN